jgi:hypothetical protein
VLSPFIVKYFQNTAFGEQDANSFSEVNAIIDYRLAQGMVDFHTPWRIFSTSCWLLMDCMGCFLLAACCRWWHEFHCPGR